MSDNIELVIKIPKDTYKDICESGLACEFIWDEDKEVVIQAVIDGTPLPKGHGRLIDAAEVEKLHEALCATECADCGVDGCFYDRAETIIEADRSEK